MTGPRVIEPHAFRRPVGPDPNNAPASYQKWMNESGWRFCDAEGCGLTADAQPHWTMAPTPTPGIGQLTDGYLYPGDHLNLTLTPPDGVAVPWLRGQSGTIYMSRDVTFVIADPVTQAKLAEARQLLLAELVRSGRARKRILRRVSGILWKLGVG